MNNKLPILALFTCIGLGVIIIRLSYLQLYCGATLLTLSKKNYERTQEIVSIRGDILDCNNIPLATNRPVRNVYWQGTGNHTLTQEQKNIISYALQHTLSIKEPTTLWSQLTYTERAQKKMLIMYDISMQQLSDLMERYGTSPNILIQTDFKRFYPYQNLAAHIVGYVGTTHNDKSGKMGLEKMFDTTLCGTSGFQRITINSLGAPLWSEEIKQPDRGTHIQTTLDISLQRIAEELFPEEKVGTFILMDPKSGALKVALSRPSFDPNLFINPIGFDTWNSIQSQKPFIHRAFNACYPPASIFKLVTTAAALEEGIIQADDIHECKGYIYFGKRRYYCMKHSGHGTLTTKEAVAFSCNPLFYTIGQKLSVNVLADYAQRFGLGAPTNLILPEKTGLIPTTEWKNKTFGERWWPGETLSVAIGQSYLLSTPIQIACMISSIFEGYLVRPRILTTEPINFRPLLIKESTRLFLQDSMRLTVTQGTGKHVRTIDDITIWAKTGTGQKSNRQRRKKEKDYKEFAWFVSYFQYKDHQPYTMVIFLEEAYSSKEATFLAKQFLVKYRQRMEQQITLDKNIIL